MRAVFVRNMKPAPSGSGSRKKKPYYLAEAMQFAVPYIKALSMATRNLPNVPLEEEDHQFRDIDTEDSVAVQDSLPLSPSQTLPPPPPPPPPPPIPMPVMPQQDEDSETERQSQPMSASRPKSKRDLNDVVDRTFVEYFEAKKARTAGTPGHNISHNQRSEALKMFQGVIKKFRDCFLLGCGYTSGHPCLQGGYLELPLSLGQLSVEAGVSYGTYQAILTHDLNMRRVAATFVPRILTAEQNEWRLS